MEKMGPQSEGLAPNSQIFGYPDNSLILSFIVWVDPVVFYSLKKKSVVG